MEGDENSEGTYMYLDFNGKLSCDLFKDEVFLRIANLHKENPLVQVNDLLFKGTHDQSIGTNLFFEETDDNSHTGNIFEKQTSKHLKYFTSSTKVLNLQQVKVPQAKAKIQNEITNINYNFNWDYRELLEKLENGTLQLEDISSGETSIQTIDVQDGDDLEKEQFQGETENEFELSKQLEDSLQNSIPIKMLEKDYEQLNILAWRPVRRAPSPELVVDCDEQYEQNYEYHNIERQVLKPRDGFKSEVLHVDESTLSDCIDIDRCVLFGLISNSSDFPRILSKEEKSKLLSLENFENLSLAGRYYVLKNLVDDLEEYVQTVPKLKLQEKDEFGHTPLETLEIYKKLRDAVRNRLQEIKFSTDGDRLEHS